MVDNNADKGNNNNIRKSDDENGKIDEVEVELISSPFNVSPKGNKVMNDNFFRILQKGILKGNMQPICFPSVVPLPVGSTIK